MKIAAKLDASPRIVWNWRYIWRLGSTRINALGAGVSFTYSTLLVTLPVAAPFYVVGSMAAFGVVLGLLFLLAIAIRYFVQPEIPGATPAMPPQAEDDNSERKG